MTPGNSLNVSLRADYLSVQTAYGRRRVCWTSTEGMSYKRTYLITYLNSNSTGTSFPVTSSRTCWRRRQLPRNKSATSYKEVGDVARPS